jgi:hypothetical protein
MTPDDFAAFVERIKDQPPEIVRQMLRSVFNRSLARGEPPLNPNNPAESMRGVQWLDSDPEWQKRFQEAYRNAEPGAVHTDPITNLSSSQAGLRKILQKPGMGDAHFNRASAHTDPYSNRVTGPLYEYPSLEGIYRMPAESQRRPQIDNGPGNPHFTMQPSDIVPSERFGMSDGPDWARVGRLNPEKLAQNLGSRVNAGPVGPWDVFPGGIEGYLRMLQEKMGMPNPFQAPSQGEML